MNRLLVAAIAAWLGLAAQASADMAEADTLYRDGHYEEAFAAYAELAKEQDGIAMLRMAEMFEAGEGVAASNTRALTWYRRAAAHDVAEAHFRIGEMYEAGTAVPRDYSAAVRAYQAAADLGHTQALIHLADLYVDGSGAMPDASQATRLLKQAADSGDPEAAAALDRLVASGIVPRNVLDELGIPMPPPPTLPTVEELAAQGIAAQDEGASITEPAEAAEVETGEIEESEAAAQVRAALTAAMAGYDSEESTLDYGIDIAENADGSMVATLRSVRVISGDGTWEMDDIVYALTPVAEATYDTVVTLPETTVIYDDTGKAAGGSTIGSQDIRGTWNVALNLWSQGTIDIRDVALQIAAPGEEAFAMAIAAITGETRLDASAPGKWGGVARMAIEDIVLSGSDSDNAQVERIDIVVDQRAIDYVFFQAMGLARAEFKRRFGAAPDLEDPSVQQAMARITEPIIALARERAPVIGDAGMAITVSGIAGQDPDTGAPVAIGRIHFALSAENMDSPAGVVKLAYEHSGLAAPVDGVMQGYMPGEAAFVIALRDLPVEDATTMALEMFEEGVADPASFQDNAMMALTFLGLGLQQSMAEAGSALEIERIAYLSEALKAHVGGTLVASMASPLGAVGTVTMEVEGLDAAVAQLSAQTDDPDAQEAAMPLAMLQAMGERVEDGGVVRHIYVVELTADGRTLLNGNDMGPMIDGLMGSTAQ